MGFSSYFFIEPSPPSCHNIILSSYQDTLWAQPELRNAKFFTQIKSLKTNFTPRKARKSLQNLAQNNTKGYFWETKPRYFII